MKSSEADRPTVSIVIAVRNGAGFIGETIKSCLRQGDPVASVIVVDDRSTDATQDVVERIGDPRIRFVGNPGQGVSSARNFGVSQGASDWVLFLDADDRLRPAALATLLRVAAEHPRAVGVYGDYERIDAEGRRIGRRFLMKHRSKPSGEVLASLIEGNFIINGGVLICRRDAVEQSGGFDESLSLCEDWHLWCKLAALGEIVFTPDLVMDYRVHGSSVMMGRQRGYERFLPALDAIYRDPSIMAKVSPAIVGRARRRAEISLLTYCAQQSLRQGRRIEALKLGARAARMDLSRAPWIAARLGGAAFGM